jgi:protoheme IX farnesyltransferase
MSLSLAYPRVTTVGDFFALLKPRVMSLVVFTGLAGIVAAPGHVHPLTAFTALLCIAVAAGASGCLNMAYDSDIDRLMSRTATRPIPMGYVAREDALAFGWTLSVASVAIMGLFVNFLAAELLAFTIFFYVVVYTLWLKRRTPQNIVIGGLAGALPPAIGWASVTGDLSLAPLLLVAIIFIWTPPHFWALSLLLKGDYARAGVPMMPVVQGDRQTRYQIVLYTVVLCLVTVLPLLTRSFGAVYLGGAAVLDGILLTDAVVAARRPSARSARRLFYHSMIYLALLFVVMAVDRVTGL